MLKNMNRESGFYWVKLDGIWQPALYCIINKPSGVSKYWEVLSLEYSFFDEDFDEIGEKIEKPLNLS